MTPYYERGGVTLYHGDCRDILPHLDRASFAAVVMDPPYGIAYKAGAGSLPLFGDAPWKGLSIANDGDVSARDWVLRWSGDLPVACFGTWRTERPANTRARLVWSKGPQAGMGDTTFPWKCSDEEVYILGRGWSGRRDESVLGGYRYVTWCASGRQHPNEKPVELLAHFVNKAPPGRILDPFAGSGSTLVAAVHSAREAVGIEVEARWCDVAAARLDALLDGVRPAERAQGQEPLFGGAA